MLSAYDQNASKAQVALSESHVTLASKPNSFSSAALSATNKGNEPLHYMVGALVTLVFVHVVLVAHVLFLNA